MRTLFLLMFTLIHVHAGGVVLSAKLGEFPLAPGATLAPNTHYTIPPKSKIQLLINNAATITLSANSSFTIRSVDALTCKIAIEQGTYKIINLSYKDKRLNLKITTPQTSVTINNAIALIKLAPQSLSIGSAKNTLAIVYNHETLTLKKDEMLRLQNAIIKKSALDFDIFDAIYIKKPKAVKEIIDNYEQQLDNPADLEN